MHGTTTGGHTYGVWPYDEGTWAPQHPQKRQLCGLHMHVTAVICSPGTLRGRCEGPADHKWAQSALSIQNMGSQGRSTATAQLSKCNMDLLQKGWWGWGDSQWSKSCVRHMTWYLRKASSSIWQVSLHFLDSSVTKFVSYFGHILDFFVIFLKTFALQVMF